MKFHLALSALMLGPILSSCTGSYEAPKVYKIEKERVYTKAYDSVWQNAVDWFALHNTPIKTMEKGSGIIASDYNLKADAYQLYSDCGIGGGGLVEKRIDSPVGNVNLLIKKIDEEHAKVTVSAFFKAILVTVNNYNGQISNSKTIECNSTGKLEKEVLDSIGK